jgi:hypothetical protein
MRKPLLKHSPTALPHKRLRASLEFLSSRIYDPVNKLWFINRTLQGFDEKSEGLKRLPIVRTIVFHYVALESLGELIWSPKPVAIALPTGPLWVLYRLRHLLLVSTILVVGFGAYRVGLVGYDAAQTGADWIFTQLIPVPAVASADILAVYPDRESLPPKSVWLVSSEGNEELWSNGLRVDTSFETAGKPRSFFAFPIDGEAPVALGGDPIGIVYHASQSDMAPLAREFNRDILTTTRELVGWLSRREIYNYMIDRFGLVYRIVSDEGVAVHAGVSIWSDDEYYYLNLNDSFVGVAFESQWNAGRDLITAAQVQAALNLTDMLRARYQIEDANCVPHGLVSVNAKRKLIGYHADWARSFPFGALGLEDKYLVPPASMTAFGFGYDEDLTHRLGGELWPGVAQAEREVIARAKDEGVTPEVFRARLHRRYLENIDLVRSRE